ncbi:hypothetical protein ABCR94_00450 [Streptomyces sp. 21So2-11]|uniref:hypothetical protein n=1 Tax=Streptomyces sp. 21So2-11 TaxID=3144408 RepID=UPI003219269D
MTTSKARLTALITPVEQEAQNEAKALSQGGRVSRAVSRLRKDSGLGLRTGSAALDLLNEGSSLPTSYQQALNALRSLSPDLVDEMSALLDNEDSTSAIKLLRERTDMDLAGGYHLVQELSGRPDTAA